MQAILDKYNEKEEKAMRGMSPEMKKMKKSQKPSEIVRTEQLLAKINMNAAG